MTEVNHSRWADDGGAPGKEDDVDHDAKHNGRRLSLAGAIAGEFKMSSNDDLLRHVDRVLIRLWMEGYKITELTPDDHVPIIADRK
jgi:hypothetical protein